MRQKPAALQMPHAASPIFLLLAKVAVRGQTLFVAKTALPAVHKAPRAPITGLLVGRAGVR